MRRLRSAALAALPLGILACCAGELHGFSGAGRAAVERAVKPIPQTTEELDALIQRLEEQRATGDGSAQTAYSLAILTLNRPRPFVLREPRGLLAEAIVAEPGFEDALGIWLDLMPSTSELASLAEALLGRSGGATSAATRWALASVERVRGNAEAAEREAQRAAELDAAYGSRARFLAMAVAAERKDDAEASRLFDELVASLDEEARRLLWKDALLVASPEEIRRYTEGGEPPEDFFRTFWKRRDVFPLTEENERLGEHLRRIAQARRDFPASTNGRGYFTSHDLFKEMSPDLSSYASDVVYDYQERMPLWLDHRGFVFVRHGAPDRQVRSSDGVRSETWLYHRFTFKPLLFHFIDRRGVGEQVLTLNLAQAKASTGTPDDPELVLSSTDDFRDLYQSRSVFHLLFQRVAVSRSRYEVEDLLKQEAQIMGVFAREAWLDDTNNLIRKEDSLPFAAYGANFRGEGGNVDAFIYYAIPEKELDKDETEFEFDATLVVYNHNWSETVRKAEHHFRHERPAGTKPDKNDALVGALELTGMEPGRYNFAFQVSERKTGKVGVSKGRFSVDYFGPEWVDVSDLLLAAEVTPSERSSIFERNGQRVVPIPTRSLSRDKPAKVYYEIYDLKPGADNQVHYRIEYQVLQIQEEPSVAEKIFGVGMNVAGLFFPYEIFLARVGLFGLDVASSNPEKELSVKVEERVASPTGGLVSELLPIDTAKMSPGVYQLYVTVKDYVSGSISTRSVRFGVHK